MIQFLNSVYALYLNAQNTEVFKALSYEVLCIHGHEGGVSDYRFKLIHIYACTRIEYFAYMPYILNLSNYYTRHTLRTVCNIIYTND